MSRILFVYATVSPRPSGIQRLSFELQQALVARYGSGGAVRFVRHDPLRASFAEIAWSDVAALYHAMIAAAATPPTQRRDEAPPRPGPARRLFGPLADRLPARIRMPLARAVHFQGQALRALVQALRGALQRGHAGPAAARAGFSAEAFLAAVQPGDVLLALGSPWWHRDYAGLIARTRARHGLRFALLLYDLIPVRHPEWCDRQLITRFAGWLDGVLPIADGLLAISRATARDVERYAAAQGIALPGPVAPIPIGTGFGPPPAAGPPSPGLPAPGSYVLFVSTIEARKNHALLFRVWRRLLAELPADRVPALVFAGRVGWLVADLLQQLANTRYLDGRVVIIEDPSDADLAALYRGCLFTVFPSLYEGWGLPVTESLAFGKPCIVADGTSLPEAGGALARYFDADNLHDAVRAIRAVLDDRAALAAWEAQIGRDFRPVPWSAGADALIAALAPELAVAPAEPAT